jgi:signal transduction histidine kinase
MELSDIINIVGITAYSLLAVFFLWVMFVPNTLSRTHYWLIAVITILTARLNLYFLPEYIPENEVQTLYIALLIIEKVFLMLGLLYFFYRKVPTSAISKVLSFASIIIVIILVLKYTLTFTFAALVIFSTSQAIFLTSMLVILFKNKQKLFIENQKLLLILFICYALHWLTYPIAINYPLWLSFGYLFGNLMNLIIYLYFAYLVLERFQYRMIQAEKSALLLVEDAKKADKAKSDFLANMSHEIRTPINGVMGMLELLTQEDLKIEHKEKINIAFNSSKSLLEVVNEVLDYSKIEAGKLTLEHVEFDIINLLTEIYQVTQNLAQTKGLTLVLDTSSIHNRHVKSDPLRFKQILLNLIGNAVKFTREGEVIIKVEQIKKDNADYLICSITDTGVGIEKSKLTEVFDSFKQADTSTTRNFGGTGLGLSISKRLCQLLKGNIQVVSEVNQGSKFTITIPVELINELDASQKEVELLTTPAWQKDIRILLVEDNRINQVVAIQILESFNLTCDVAENGAIALAKLKVSLKINIPYTCVLMDCQMPTLDGYEATKRIRLGECGDSYKNIPIIAMTANAMEGDREKCISTGMNDYIAKPIEKHLMLGVLKKWLPECNK